jgi:hypothetical protein
MQWDINKSIRFKTSGLIWGFLRPEDAVAVEKPAFQILSSPW